MSDSWDCPKTVQQIKTISKHHTQPILLTVRLEHFKKPECLLTVLWQMTEVVNMLFVSYTHVRDQCTVIITVSLARYFRFHTHLVQVKMLANLRVLDVLYIRAGISTNMHCWQ